jgi:Holliday junction resolvase RusA-like endonuclease
MNALLDFFVPGRAVPQGSKKAWYNAKIKKTFMREAQGDRLDSWRTDVAAYARQERTASEGFPLTDAVAVSLTFYFKRNAGDYGTGKNAKVLKPSASVFPIKPPDIDKITRAIFDALTTAGVWVDDAQVVTTTQRKRWVDRFSGEEGVHIKVGCAIMPSDPA